MPTELVWIFVAFLCSCCLLLACLRLYINLLFKRVGAEADASISSAPYVAVAQMQ